MPQEPPRAASPTLPPPAAPKASPDVTGSLPPRAVALPAPGAPYAMPPTMPNFSAPLQIASAGSQGPAQGQPVVALASPAAAPLGSDKLPVGIGGAALRAAAAAGDAAAQYEVAARYADGRGVPASLEEAARWYERSAAQGIAPAQFRLGSLYEKGQGVKKDLDTARRLYIDAAGKGHAKAMHNLAVLYAEGIDGKPDFHQAAQWFRKGADRGVTDSEYNLGILYARGIGVEQNFAESFKWFSLAAQQGDKDAAKKRDDMAGRLDPQSLTAAKLAIQTWTAEPQPDAATTVKTPPGGWDSAAADPKAKHK
jgi:localization factor PodJL